MDDKLSDAEISMILDTFMYLDYREAREGTSLNEILQDLESHPDYGGGGIHFGEYTVLKKAAANDAVGSLVIGCQSVNMGYDPGTAAAAFATPDGESVYVAYRGTGDGEWPDNGIGMTQAITIQQARALSYFDRVVETMDLKESQRVIVTGHSKGGNKAQFVAMETQYGDMVDACYSVDGQGFSEQAVDRWKEKYGEKGYESRREKLFGIYGENDYVSVLGNPIIGQEHIRYIRTPIEKSNFAGYHDIKYMFASLEYDEKAGSYITVFNGRKNGDTGKRGELGEYAALLSAGVMELAPEKRDGCAAIIMQLMEATGGRKGGLNGEKVTLADLRDFTFQGIPVIAKSLLGEREGKRLIGALLKKDVAFNQLPTGISLEVNYQTLFRQAGELQTMASRIKEQAKAVGESATGIPLYMKNGTTYYHRLKLSARAVDDLVEKLQKAAALQEELAGMYRGWDGAKIK